MAANFPVGFPTVAAPRTVENQFSIPGLLPSPVASVPPFTMAAVSSVPTVQTKPVSSDRMNKKRQTKTTSAGITATGTSKGEVPAATVPPVPSPTVNNTEPLGSNGAGSNAVSPALILGLIISVMTLISVTGVCLHRHTRRRRERKLDEERRQRLEDACDGNAGMRGVDSYLGDGTGPAPRPSGLSELMIASSHQQRSLLSLPASRYQSWSTAAGTANISVQDRKDADALRRASTSARGMPGSGTTNSRSAGASSSLGDPVAPPLPHRQSGSRLSRASFTVQESEDEPPPIPATVYYGKEGPMTVHVCPADLDPVAASFALPADAIGTWDGPAPPGGFYDEPGTAFEGYAERMFTAADESEAVERVRRAQEMLQLGVARTRDGGPSTFPFAAYLERTPYSPSTAIRFASSAPPVLHCRRRRLAATSRKSGTTAAEGEDDFPPSPLRTCVEGYFPEGSDPAENHADHRFNCSVRDSSDCDCSCSSEGEGETEKPRRSPVFQNGPSIPHTQGNPCGAISPMDILEFPQQRWNADLEEGTKLGTPQIGVSLRDGRQRYRQNRRTTTHDAIQDTEDTGQEGPSAVPQICKRTKARWRPMQEGGGPQEIIFGCSRRSRYPPAQPSPLVSEAPSTSSRSSVSSPPTNLLSPSEHRHSQLVREYQAACVSGFTGGGGSSREDLRTTRHSAALPSCPNPAAIGHPQRQSDASMARKVGILKILRESDDGDDGRGRPGAGGSAGARSAREVDPRRLLRAIYK